MVSKEPSCLPTTNCHSNGNPEKSTTMTVRSVLLNRNSPDIESRLKRRRNRTHQVRFKDLEDGDGPGSKPERRSPHPSRKGSKRPATPCWRDEVANGPSLVGSVRGDMESTIGAVEEFLKRAPRHPLTPGPTRRTWAPPRPCSLTLPLPRQPCMSTAIQTSPSLQKPLGLPRSQSLGSSIRADWDEDEDEDLVVGIATTPVTPPEQGHGDKPGTTCSSSQHSHGCQSDGPCSSKNCTDLGDHPCTCPKAAPKSIPGRYRGRRRRITRTASDPGRSESPAVSPARVASPSGHMTRTDSPNGLPPQKSPTKSCLTQTDPPSLTSPEKASLPSEQVDSHTSQESQTPCTDAQTPSTSTTPVLSEPGCTSSSSPKHCLANTTVLPDVNNNESGSSGSSPRSALTPPEVISNTASETSPCCPDLTLSVSACQSLIQPIPSCQSPTQAVTNKTPTQSVPCSITAAKSMLTPEKNVDIMPPSETLLQSLPPFEASQETTCELPTQPLKGKSLPHAKPSDDTAATALPTNPDSTETKPLLISSIPTSPYPNPSVQSLSNTFLPPTITDTSQIQPVSVPKSSLSHLPVCETPKQPVSTMTCPAEPISTNNIAQPAPRSTNPAHIELCCQTPMQSVSNSVSTMQSTQPIQEIMTPMQLSSIDCVSSPQPIPCKAPSPSPSNMATDAIPLSVSHPVLDCATYTEITGPSSSMDSTGLPYSAGAPILLPSPVVSHLPPCISERVQVLPCPSHAHAIPQYFTTTNSVHSCIAMHNPPQFMSCSTSASNTLPACIIPESAVPPYVTQQTIQVSSSSPFKMIPPGFMPNQTSTPNVCIRQVAFSQTMTPVPAQQVCPATYLQHAAPPYGSSPKASPSPAQAPMYTTQDRRLPPPPPPPPPYTPRKEGSTATGQTRRPQTPKPASAGKEKEKEREKVGNGVVVQHTVASGGHICRRAAGGGGSERATGVGVPCVTPKNSAQAAIKAATMGARRALFGSDGQACSSQCPRPITPCGQQQGSAAQSEGPQADAFRHVQELLGGLMSGARCKLDLARAKEKLLGPNGPLYDIGTLQSQLHSLEGVLETSQNTIKVLLDVIQDLEKKEAERDGRHSYRTGQDIENCGTCRDCACIIYSVEHDFRQQEGQVTRAWRVPQPYEAEQGSPQTVLPAPTPTPSQQSRNQDSPQSVKKSRKKCFWFL